VEYDELVGTALAVPFEGWDFGVFEGRFTDPGLPWEYERMVRQRLPRVTSLLDLGTGGGELLSSLAPLPTGTAATEGYPPNVPVARRRLAPLGVEVAEAAGDGVLPFPDGSFELVTSRHEAYSPAELARVLAPHGEFVTQQVGGQDLAQLNAALGAPPHTHGDWDLATARRQLADAGFEITWQAETHMPAEFHDIGALVLFLRVTPWQVPDFTVARYEKPLHALHDRMRVGEPLRVSCHRFVLTARVRR
jgi:SAM-dependent methyltransferase